MVARRLVDGRHHLQQRHAQPGDRHRAPQRRGGELGLVGVPAHRRLDGLLLRAPVAAFGSADRSRVLRDPLLGHGRQRGARLPRHLPGPAVQLHDHGDGQPGRGQDRRHPVRAGTMADAARRRPAERRLRGPFGPVGRAGHRHDPVLHQDDGGDRRRLLRPSGAAGRRAARADRQALDHARAGRGGLPGRAARLQQQLGPGRRRLHHADRGAVVGGLVPGVGAGRRQLRRAADAGLAIGTRRTRGGPVLQRRPLRPASLALDHRRARVAAGLSRALGHPGGVPGPQPAACSATTSPTRRC